MVAVILLYLLIYFSRFCRICLSLSSWSSLSLSLWEKNQTPFFSLYISFLWLTWISYTAELQKFSFLFIFILEWKKEKGFSVTIKIRPYTEQVGKFRIFLMPANRDYSSYTVIKEGLTYFVGLITNPYLMTYSYSHYINIDPSLLSFIFSLKYKKIQNISSLRRIPIPYPI